MRRRRKAQRPETKVTRVVGVPSAAEPLGDVADDQPSAQVLDELLAVFSADQIGPRPRRRVDLTDVEANDPAPPTMSTRAMSVEEIEAEAKATPPPSPGGLTAEPTKRSTRRSRREMRKEAKLAAKREAGLAKDRRASAKKKAKQTKKAKKRRRGDAQPTSTPDRDLSPGIHETTPPSILPAAPPSSASPTVAPPPTGAQSPPAPARPVTIIADDDLADPVYLEGELTAGSAPSGTSARSRVFIDDQDPATGSMVSIDVATSASRMEPRLRERRLAVHRAIGRKRLKWVAMVLSVVFVLVGALALLGSSMFAVKTVDVQGAVYSRGPAFDAVVDDIDGANVLRLDTAAAERALEAIPWVETARVTTQFPHGARIEIDERQPSVAYLGADQGYRVLDDQGRVLDVVVGGRPSHYIELMVTDGPNLTAGAMAPSGYRAAAMLVQSLPAPLRSQVATVSVDAAGTDLRLELRNGVDVRFGAAQELVDKIVRLQVALTNPDPDQATPTQLIDVSTDDIILK